MRLNETALFLAGFAGCLLILLIGNFWFRAAAAHYGPQAPAASVAR